MIRVARWLVIAAVSVASVSAISTRAQDEAPPFALQLVQGSCEAPAAAVATLEPLTTSAASDAADVSVVYRSYSQVPGSIDSLIASPHAIVVSDSASTAVACGNLGSSRDDSGAVAIGLEAVGGSGWAGIAYLSPISGNAGATGLSTFVARIGGEAVATPALAAGDYTPTMRSQVSLVVASLQRIDSLFNAPHAADPQWVTQVLAECSLWHMLYREAQAITPPEEYAGFHQRYLEALALLDGAADDISVGLTSNDGARLDQAGPKISDAVAILRSLDDSESPATPGSTPVAVTIPGYFGRLTA